MNDSKKLIQFILIIGVILLMTACNNSINENKMITENTVPVFPKGERITNGYFTGEAYLQMLLSQDENNEFSIGNVTFEPGARTNWHTHPKGQVLLILDGEGLYQEKGKPVQIIKKGDVINIPENVEHWHGASAQSKMVHVAITNYKDKNNVIWLSPVTKDQYSEANRK